MQPALERKWGQTVQGGMGTRITHKAYGENPRRAFAAVQAELKRLEKLLSRFEEGSEISKINRIAGLARVKISRETFSLLHHAQQISRLCGGAFDVTIGPLVKLWNVCHAGHSPKEADILAARALTGFSMLVLDRGNVTAKLTKPGQMIDLGGVGKGYASDRAMEVFARCGIRSAYTNIGGNVSTLGAKPDGSPWQVGIRHPRQAGQMIGAVSVVNKAVVTSGDYERYFVDEAGKRRHHLLDPATGYPAESGLISVTVVSKSAMEADALSTVLFVSGLQKGLKLLRHFPSAQAVLVNDQLGVTITGGLKDCFTPAFGIRAECTP